MGGLVPGTALGGPRLHPRKLTGHSIMEAERINLIGTTLADLTLRTQELRGYL